MMADLLLVVEAKAPIQVVVVVEQEVLDLMAVVPLAPAESGYNLQ
jgi:hypothetical protein